MFDVKEHLKSLVEAHAPSGHEAPVREIIRASWEDLVDEFESDKLGSLIGIKRATKSATAPRRIMLAAHMDEIAFIVREIVNGFLFVQKIAGIDNRVMMAQPVLVHGKRPLKGVIASVPSHLSDAETRKKYLSTEQLVIDVGLPAAEVEALVNLGDVVTPDVDLLELQHKHFAAKAMDDRACVAAVTLALHELQSIHHSWDIYATATVQEETGLFGATTAAYHIQPDIAIALDVTFADQPGVSKDDSSEMGSGPRIALGANIHPKLYDKLVEVAKYQEIKYQIEPIPGATGTDAWAIQVARNGIPTALLSIPLRNMHSPIETLNLQDIERTGRLLAHFIASLDDDFLSAIDWDEIQAEEA